MLTILHSCQQNDEILLYIEADYNIILLIHVEVKTFARNFIY